MTETWAKALIVAATVLLAIGLTAKLVPRRTAAADGATATADRPESGTRPPAAGRRATPRLTRSLTGANSRGVDAPAVPATLVTANPARSTPTSASPEAVAALVNQLADPKTANRLGLLNELGTLLAMLEDGKHAVILDALAKCQDDNERQQLLTAYLYKLGQLDPLSAIAFAQQVQERVTMDSTRSDSMRFSRFSALASVFRGWASVDPTAAARWAEQQPADQLRFTAITAIASAWADQDLAAAITWAQRLTETGGFGTAALDMLASRWAASDLDAAVAYCRDLPQGTVRDTFLTGIVSRWMANDPAAALASIQELASDSARQGAIFRAVVQWSASDPAAAAQWVNSLDANASLRTQALASIVRNWARTDAPSMLAFLRQVTDPQTRSELAGAAAAEIVSADPRTAFALLAEVQPGNRAAAIESLVINWARSDPAAAADWVEDLTNGGDRQAAASNVALQWARRDADAAANWIRSLPRDSARYSAVLAYAVASTTFTDQTVVSRWREAMGRQDLSRETVAEWLQRGEISAEVRNAATRLL